MKVGATGKFTQVFTTYTSFHRKRRYTCTISVGEAFKQTLFERIEDEYDVAISEEAYREHGSPLKGDLSGLRRYRIGDYRLICHIDYGALIILALNVGHRRQIYR